MIAPASLDGHRFLINQRGFATIEHTGDPNDVVWGLLWDVTQKHLDALDGFEGVAAGRYLRETIGAAHTDQADPVAAVVYRDPITDPGAPRTGYLERVISGALAHELPAAYINDVLRPFATK